MRGGHRQTKDVRCDLQGGHALAAAPGHPDFANGDMAAAAGAFGTLPQGIGQSFQDGAVDMGAGMDIAKSNNGAFGLRPGLFETGCPVGLEHQSQTAGFHRIDQLIK